MTTEEQRIKKLPVWVRGLIRQLRGQRDTARKEAAVQWQDEPTEFCIKRMIFTDGLHTYQYLPLERSSDDVCVGPLEIGPTGEEIQCQVMTSDGSLLLVRPNCANVVLIEAEQR